MKRIVQICLIMTGIFLGVFNVYGSSTYQILKDQQIEFTDILVEGDSLVLVRNEKNGFSSEGIYLGVYNCVERMWTVEYQAYDEYLKSSYYAGDGIFALSDGETTTLLNTKTQKFLKLDINVNFNDLHFYNGCAVSGARESYGDQLYGIYEIDEDGNYQNTGITDFITEDKILSPDDFEFVYADGKQVVYIYDGEEFYIYDVVAAEVYDIYHPDYEKYIAGNNEEKKHGMLILKSGEVVNTEYQKYMLSYTVPDIVGVYDGANYGMLGSNGELIVPCSYDSCEISEDGAYITADRQKDEYGNYTECTLFDSNGNKIETFDTGIYNVGVFRKISNAA